MYGVKPVGDFQDEWTLIFGEFDPQHPQYQAVANALAFKFDDLPETGHLADGRNVRSLRVGSLLVTCALSADGGAVELHHVV